MRRNTIVVIIVIMVILVIIANVIEFNFVFNSDAPDWIKWLVLKG